MSRRQTLEQAFRAHGIVEAERLESYIRGCDLTRPVTRKTLRPGPQTQLVTLMRPVQAGMLRPRAPSSPDYLQIWVRDRGKPGQFAAPPGEDPATLGIMIEGRHSEIYEVREPLRVVVCVAARFPAGLVERVGGEGGGVQYILPPDWFAKVERIL